MSTATARSSVPEFLDMDADGHDYSAAELRLIDAIRAGAVCDFADGAEITATEMVSWGPGRTIRAALLRRLLTAEDAKHPAVGVRLRGAAVEGLLDLAGMNVIALELQQCRIATVQAKQATFTGGTNFAGAMFTGDAWFAGATFTGHPLFDHATFTRDAWFHNATFTGNARFGGATFTGDAGFAGATFTGDAGFAGATFTGDTRFHDATFTGDAGFYEATFTGDAGFAGATFTGDARFYSATFTSNANFGGATFTRTARFENATFTGTARFTEATFTGNAEFTGAMAEAYDLSKAQFRTTDPGPWIARRVTLAGTVFHLRARVGVGAVRLDCRRMQAREGVHLIVRGDVVDFMDAEMLRRSILEHSASWPAVLELAEPAERPAEVAKLPPAEQSRWNGYETGFQLRKSLAAELHPQQTKPTRVVCLCRATAGDLVLSGIGLEDCAFAGAHGLDKLRIDATCSFRQPPRWLRDTWRPFTGRQVIREEGSWRETHTRGWAPASSTVDISHEQSHPVPTALQIAGIYRDLRKGLEDAKDEPGAADFYYGEMEMRRLAAREGHHSHDIDRNGARGRLPSWTERRLLDAYWAVSGYGLRAWRALTALTVLLVGCAVLFATPAFAHLPESPQHLTSVNLSTGAPQYALGAYPGDKPDTGTTVTFARSLEFTARESLTLTRDSGAPLLVTTGIGTALDIALRLLAPLLLGLAVLAVRGRTKR